MGAEEDRVRRLITWEPTVLDNFQVITRPRLSSLPGFPMSVVRRQPTKSFFDFWSEKLLFELAISL
jgi:hypothetical protein